MDILKTNRNKNTSPKSVTVKADDSPQGAKTAASAPRTDEPVANAYENADEQWVNNKENQNNAESLLNAIRRDAQALEGKDLSDSELKARAVAVIDSQLGKQ